MTTKIPFQNLIAWKYPFDRNKREVLIAMHGYNAIIKAVHSHHTIAQQAERLCEVTVYCGVWRASFRKIQQYQYSFRFQYEWLAILNRYHCIFSSTSTPVFGIRIDWMNKIFFYWKTPKLDTHISIFIQSVLTSVHLVKRKPDVQSIWCY